MLIKDKQQPNGGVPMCGTKASGSTTGAFLLELSSSGKCEIWVDGYGSKNRVRPILAF